ncbi:uncharacterized protein LOC126381365 [Pectinophora gossypiella]|uniref:uncharacterized protein LOC126381365 n=1 Tax=Pectinophora gossypiella TaxID=13191 RepID=UPI00214E8A5F|nr:uncharacterized protein LOC126381365 [Pectinophora gossypiella]
MSRATSDDRETRSGINNTENKGTGMACGTSSVSEASVNAVKVRVPPFWPEEPEIWFAQIENQFSLANITKDETKFNIVSGDLSQEYARLMKDFYTNPPKENKYSLFKAALIKRLTDSREKKTLQLLQNEDLGDRKPTQFLRHLQSLAGPDMPDEFIRTVWTSRLPTHVQTIVASQPNSSLEAVADLADRVVDIVQAQPVVASTSMPTRSPGTALEERVAQLTRQVEALMKKGQAQYFNSSRRGRSRSRSSRSRSRSNSRGQRPEGHPHCWYHYTFGSKARKCTPPCSFQAENSKGSR